MLSYVAGYVAAAAAFLALDAVWLSYAAERVYRPILGDILAPKISVAPGAVFYAIYIFGVMFLAVAPAVKAGSWTRAAIAGAVLGVVAYATYDLTNQATLRTWSTRITLLDIGWGLAVTTVASLAGYWATRAAGRALGAE